MTNYKSTMSQKGLLYHHGIKGQRWGIRRYQNADGSLTPAGEKRYSDIKDWYKEYNKKQFKQNREYAEGKRDDVKYFKERGEDYSVSLQVAKKLETAANSNRSNLKIMEKGLETNQFKMDAIKARRKYNMSNAAEKARQAAFITGVALLYYHKTHK